MKFTLINGGKSESSPPVEREDKSPFDVKELTDLEVERLFMDIVESFGKLYTHFLDIH